MKSPTREELTRQIEPNCGSVFPVVALGLLGLVAGIYHANAVAIAFGLPLILGPLLLYWAVSSALHRIEVERDCPDAVFEGESVEVTVRIRNHFWFPVFYPMVLDVFTPEIHAQKRTHFPYRVPPGEEIEERYSGECLLPRGVYRLGEGVLSLSDPFGWIQLHRFLDFDHSIKVYPRIQRAPLPERLGDVIAALRDEHTCVRRGESLEFFSVRDYHRGDPLRKIHWPLTAHRGFPVVREFSQNSVGNVSIFMDLCRSALIGIGRGSSLEHAVKLAVAVSDHALRRGLQVQVFAHGRQDLSLQPLRGRNRIQPILDLAAELRPNGELRLDEFLAQNEHRLRPGDCAVFTVSPYLFESDRFLARLHRLRLRGVRLVAAIFDDTTFRTLWHGEQPSQATRLAFSAKLTAMGVETYPVACGVNLEQVFRRDTA